MKRISIGLSLLLGIMLLSGCKQNDIELKTRFDSFYIELGNPILKASEYYIDKIGMSDNDLRELYQGTKANLKANKEDLMRGQYEKTGTYQMTLTYNDQVKEFDVLIKDTRAPQIVGDNILYVKTKSKTDYKSLYKVVDFNDVEDLIVDDSQVDINKTGDYKLYLSVKDKAGNIGEKEVTVKVQDIVKKEVMEQVFIDIPYYNQLDVNAPNGCEATSLYMALKYKYKIDIDLTKFIDGQPRSRNPNEGFAGNPFGFGNERDDYYTIFPTPLATYASQYSKCKDITGYSIEEIKRELASDHPVAVYVTGGLVPARERTFYFGKVIGNLHIVLLNGYDDEKQMFHVLDPIDKDITSVSYQDFSKAYDLTRFAISVE